MDKDNPGSAVTWSMLVQESEVPQMIAETCGVDISVAKLAFDAAGFDAETAIDMLTHAASMAPETVSKSISEKSHDDAVNIICDSTGCDISTATVALKDMENDLDAAVDMICTGQLEGHRVVQSHSMNPTTTCCHAENPAENQVFSLTAREVLNLDLGDSLCCWRHCDIRSYW
jgi:hypothetical protein